MNPIEIVGEFCTIDSAWIQGWRWLFSPRYRERIRAECQARPAWLVVAGVLEAVAFMVAEIAAVVLFIRWLV